MLNTSHNINTNIQLSIVKETVEITNLPISSSFDEIMLFLIDDYGNEYNKKDFDRSGKIRLNFSNLTAGIYYFQLYRVAKKSFLQRQYWSYLDSQDIPIVIKNDRSIKFKTSPVYIHNFNIFNKFRTDKAFLVDCLQPTPQSQSDNDKIKTLARNITQNNALEYHKIRSIHDWIADNIYYDMDTFYSGNFQNADTSALGTLLSKRSVCQGYSDLSVAMLRAIGIPATGLSCFALGISTEKKWTTQILNSSETNHRITMAYTQNRWLIMDITWDSDNEYKNGVFSSKSGMGRTYKYFDVTIPFLSFSHRLA
jgi:transglutaminase-like putative cysteine protease